METRNRQHTRQLLLSLRRQYPRGLVRMEGMDEEDARELGLTGEEDEVIFSYSSPLNSTVYTSSCSKDAGEGEEKAAAGSLAEPEDSR